MKKLSVIICLALILIITGCATTDSSKGPDERRQEIMAMRQKTLGDLYKIKPDVKAQIEAAPGYAVFSNINVNIILASFGGGYGVVKNNLTNENTYMRMGEVGIGLGFGAKDFRVVFVFHNEATMNRFVEHGWVFGAQADAAAKSGDKGAAVGGEATVDNMSIYQLTETGLALQATIKGTKYWKDESLN